MKAIVPVSVIVPIYGHLDSISRALDSIVTQTVLPQEVLIINDGGSDVVIEFLELAIQKTNVSSWIRLINLPNNIGAGCARNIGWEVSLGEYVAFLDADDAWHPRKLEIQYSFMNSNKNIVLSGHLHRVEIGMPEWSLYKITTLSKSISKISMLLFNPFVTPSVMVKNAIPQRFSATQRYSEDYQLWLAIKFSGLQVAILQSELACIFKPSISKKGLSSNLLAMESGEIKAYLSILQYGWHYFPVVIFLVPYSLLKFMRRIFLVSMLR